MLRTVPLPWTAYKTPSSEYEVYCNTEHLRVYSMIFSATRATRCEIVQKRWRLKQSVANVISDNKHRLQHMQQLQSNLQAEMRAASIIRTKRNATVVDNRGNTCQPECAQRVRECIDSEPAADAHWLQQCRSMMYQLQDRFPFPPAPPKRLVTNYFSPPPEAYKARVDRLLHISPQMCKARAQFCHPQPHHSHDHSVPCFG